MPQPSRHPDAPQDVLFDGNVPAALLDDASLDRLLTARPDDAELNRLCNEVASGVMFTLRAEASASTRPLTLVPPGGSGRWSLSLAAAAAVSACVTLAMAVAVGSGTNVFRSTAPVPSMAVVGPVDLVNPSHLIDADPFVALTASLVSSSPRVNVAGIVAFEGVDASTRRDAVAGVQSPFADDASIYQREAPLPARRFVFAATENAEILGVFDAIVD